MHPTVRRTASPFFVSRNVSTSNRSYRLLLTALSLLSVLFLLAAIGARGQAVSGAVSLAPVINTAAGNGTQGYNGDGVAATSAELNFPNGVALDSAGNLYIADYLNNRIRKVDAATGTISTVAGSGTQGYGGDGGPATSAALSSPAGVAVDGAGNLYIADTNNNCIRKVTASTGYIRTVAGNGTPGFSGDGAVASNAQLQYPEAVAVDGAGNLYIADTSNNRIRMVTASTGNISTVAGDGTAGFNADGGTATAAELNGPESVAVDGASNLYIADTTNNRIRKVTASTGDISTVAGTGTAGFSGDGGAATAAALNNPYDVILDRAGNLFIADYSNQRVREVTASTGDISTVAGNGTAGFSGDGGLPGTAELNAPVGVAVDSTGNLYISDLQNQRVRKDAANASLSPTAVGATSASQNIYVELTAASALSGITVPKAQNNVQEFTVGAVSGCAVDGATSNPAGTVCTVPITVTPQYPGVRTGALTLSNGATFVGSVGLTTSATGPLGVFVPGTQQIVNATGLSYPYSTAVDGVGNLYIADVNHVVQVPPSGAQTTITTGVSSPFGVAVDAAGDLYVSNSSGGVVKVAPGGVQTAVPLSGTSQIFGIAVDGSGNLYAVDIDNNKVVEVTPGGKQTTVPAAGLQSPFGVAVDGAGNVYIADTGNNRVVEVTPGGIQTTIGIGLSSPEGVGVDAAGNVYIADAGNNRVVALSPAGVQVTLATGLNNPYGVTVDPAGNVYIADTSHNRVVELAQIAPALTFASTKVGQTSTDSPQSVTLANIGNQTLTFTDVVASTNFNLNGSTETCTNSTVLVPSNSCVLGIEFAPTAAGALTGTAKITDDNLNAAGPNYAVQQVDLSGTGVAGYAAAIALSENPGTSVTYGMADSVTATVSGSNGTPTGNITYTVDGGSVNTLALSNGAATFLLPASLPVGTHSVTVNYGGDGNYNLSTPSQSFNLTVNPAALTVTAANATRTYGAANPTFTGTITGAVNGDSFTETFATTATASSSVGSYPITPAAAGANLSNYTVTNSNGTLTVTNATLTATAANATRIYGAANPTFTGTITGAVNGDNFTETFATTATASSSVGGYPITPTAVGANLSNYTVNASNGTLTVTAATLTVAANSSTRVYGGMNPTFTGTITGAVNGDSFTESFATAATAGSAIGTYPITPTATGTHLSDYTVVATNGALTITAAPLTITANNATRAYGAANPAFTGAITGAVNGDSFAETFATTATPSSAIGTYAIVPTANGANLSNYAVTTGNGALTVTGTVLTVAANNATRIYGTANPIFTGGITGAVNGDSFAESFATTATTTSNAGMYPIVPTATGANLADYTVVPQNGSLSITQAGSTLAVTASANQAALAAGVTLTATATSTTSGVPTGIVTFSDGSTTLGTGVLNAQGVATLSIGTLQVGSYSITASYAGDVNFKPSQAQLSGTITIGTPNLTITSSVASLSIAPGQAGTATLTLTPTFGYSGTVNFSCGNLPAHAVCSFSPATVSFSGNTPAKVTLTIATSVTGSARSSSTTLARLQPLHPIDGLPLLPAIFFWLPGTGLTLDDRKQKEPRKNRTKLSRMAWMLALLVMGAGLLGLAGCGAMSNSTYATPPGQQTVKITATGSGGVSQSVSLQVTIQ